MIEKYEDILSSATLAFSGQRYDIALDYAKKAMKMEPKNPAGYFTAGKICMSDEKLSDAKSRFNMKYPLELKKNVIDRNMRLLHNSMPSYDHQILKAIKRKDKVNLGNRVTAFMDSYFDVIFALNEVTHPGEKRLVQKCKEQCEILPNNFERNIEKLFEDLYVNPNMIEADISEIIKELERII